LQAMPISRAVVAKTQDGYEIEIRSMRELAEGETRHSVAARILLDSKFAVSSEELVWTSDVQLR